MTETIESIREIKENAVKGFLETDISIGAIRQPYETGRGVEGGQPHYYIKIAGIGFFVSEESADLVLEKIMRIKEIGRAKKKERLKYAVFTILQSCEEELKACK